MWWRTLVVRSIALETWTVHERNALLIERLVPAALTKTIAILL
jgi:hypothetical protein